MHKIVRGALTFRRQMFAAYRDLFQRLATDGQRPQALYIGCSDSRVVPNLITMSDPGDLFIVRNVGNLVPSPGFADTSVTSAVEYALGVLEIRDIIVCGHTRCGAMRALLSTDPLPQSLQRWLTHATEARSLLDTYYPELSDPEARAEKLTQVNVLVQLEHLRTHALVAERLAAGALHLHGWIFDVQTGHVLAYQPDAEQFVPLEEQQLELPGHGQGDGDPRRDVA